MNLETALIGLAMGITLITGLAIRSAMRDGRRRASSGSDRSPGYYDGSSWSGDSGSSRESSDSSDCGSTDFGGGSGDSGGCDAGGGDSGGGHGGGGSSD